MAPTNEWQSNVTERSDAGGRDDLPMVSCIVISWNRVESVLRCVGRLLNADYPHDRFEVLIVDNASSDGTPKLIAERLHHDRRVRLVRNPLNVMTSGAVNAGVNAAKGDWLFLLADDNEVEARCIRELVAGAKRNGADIVSPKMYFGIGADRRIFSIGTHVSLWGLPTKSKGAGDTDIGQFEDDWPVQCVHNALMVNRKVFDTIGGFDCRNFPMQNEEADFCLRANQVGFRIYVIGHAILRHNVDPDVETIRVGCRDFGLESPARAFLTGRNRSVLIRKHGRLAQKAVYHMLMLPLAAVGYIGLMMISPRYRSNIAYYAEGVRCGVVDVVYRDPLVPTFPLAIGDARWRRLYLGEVPRLVRRQ